MNEKFSHRSFDRVVGLTEEMKEHNEEVKAYLDRILDEDGGSKIEGYEVEKKRGRTRSY